MDTCREQHALFDTAIDEVTTTFEGLDEIIRERMSRICSIFIEAENNAREQVRAKLLSKMKKEHLDESTLQFAGNIVSRLNKLKRSKILGARENCALPAAVIAINATKAIDDFVRSKRNLSSWAPSFHRKPKQLRILPSDSLEVKGNELVLNRFLRAIQRGMPYLMGVEVDKLVLHSETNGIQGGNNEHQCPWGLAVHQLSGNIYVGEYTYHKIRVYSPELKLMRTIGSYGNEKGQLNYPIGLTFTPLGHLAVVEHVTQRVQIFNSKGQHVCFIGGRNSRHLGLTNVYSAAFSWSTSQEDEERGDIEVSDDLEDDIHVDQSLYNQISVFLADIDCQDIKKVNVGSGAIENLIRPPGNVRGFSSVLIDKIGRLVAAGVHGDALYYFGKDGKFLQSVSIPMFRDYCYLAHGPDDGVVVSQQATGKILFFDVECNCYASMELNRPVGISFDYDGRFVVAERDSAMVRVFASNK